MRYRAHNDVQAGLTLLELVIALGVLAILGALALPAMAHRADRQRLAAVAETLAADLREARFEASRHIGGIGLNTQPGPQWCWSLVAGSVPSAPCSCSTDQGCALKQVSAAAHPGIVMQAGQAVQLSPEGIAQTTTVALFESRRGEQLRVDLLAVGRARICSPTGLAAYPLSRYPKC